jgi:hypothetical protein
MQRTSTGAPLRDIQDHGARVARSDQFEWLARAGMLARGVVYAVIGILAIKLAIGAGGKTTNQQGALQTIVQQPFGKVLLILVAIGLAGYALWRLVGAVVADDFKDRISGVLSGIGYGGLCITAVQIVAGASAGSGSPDKTTGGVLGWPGGQFLVGIAAVIIIAVGFEQGYTGVKRKFMENTKTEEMGPRMRKAFTAVGVFGHLARMVIFVLIGWFLLKAAIDYDPDKAVSLDGALAALRDSSYGPFLLGIVAAGLIGFALFSALDARYRRV